MNTKIPYFESILKKEYLGFGLSRLSFYAFPLEGIEICGGLAVLCSEIRHCAKWQTITPTQKQLKKTHQSFPALNAKAKRG